MIDWRWLIVAFLAGALAVAAVSSAAVRQAHGRADRADSVAAALREVARADSAASAERKAAYDTAVAVAMRETQANQEAQRALEREQAARRRDRVAAAQRFDSVVSTVSDTAQFVPRATYDATVSAAREERDAAQAETAAVAGRLRVSQRDVALFRALYQAADSGWVAERQVSANLREALAAQVRATDEWRRAANPGLAARLLGDAKPFLAGVGTVLGVRAALAAGSP